MPGSHDIAHCTGTHLVIGHCPIRNKCHRYLQHLEIDNGTYQYPVSYFGVPFLTKEQQALPENEQWVDDTINWNKEKGKTIPPDILKKLIICHEYWEYK